MKSLLPDLILLLLLLGVLAVLLKKLQNNLVFAQVQLSRFLDVKRGAPRTVTARSRVIQ